MRTGGKNLRANGDGGGVSGLPHARRLRLPGLIERRSSAMERQEFITTVQREWATDSRWEGITRPYSAGDVYRLRGSIDIEYTLARLGAARLWELLQEEAFVPALSAVAREQALPPLPAGPPAVYVDGREGGGA